MKLPQECPKCGADLSDPTLPADREKYREQFSKVLMDANEFQCPVCLGTWPRGPKRKKRSGDPRLR